jgi:hypothetical protein
MEKEKIFSANGAGKNWISILKKTKQNKTSFILDPYLAFSTKILKYQNGS